MDKGLELIGSVAWVYVDKSAISLGERIHSKHRFNHGKSFRVLKGQRRA
jgi:hypothetical protein